ncbi:MAG: hypothetical protein SFW67_28365 [Myxococcaceae bacterium]|nr:hypothetical protein [Myxococcaceae bacterium]
MALNDTTELISLARLRGSIPSNSPDWNLSALLAQASRELLSTHLPMLVAARGEYLVKTVDLPCVQGQRAYRLPARCAAVRGVQYLQADGGVRTLEEATPMDLSDAEVNLNRIGTPIRYVFTEHSLELFPLPQNAADSIRVKYHVRPSRLIDTANATTFSRAITGISPNTPVAGQTRLTFATLGSSFTGVTVDFVKATSPFDIMAFDVPVVSAPSGTQLDFASANLPADLAVGDWWSTSNYSPFPNMPVELHEPLALRLAAAVVTAKDPKLARNLEAEADAKEKRLLVGILAPRSKGNVKRLVGRDWRRL